MIGVAFKKPDAIALGMLLDRIMDKPIAPIEMKIEETIKEATLSKEDRELLDRAIDYAIPLSRRNKKNKGKNGG